VCNQYTVIICLAGNIHPQLFRPEFNLVFHSNSLVRNSYTQPRQIDFAYTHVTVTDHVSTAESCRKIQPLYRISVPRFSWIAQQWRWKPYNSRVMRYRRFDTLDFLWWYFPHRHRNLRKYMTTAQTLDNSETSVYYFRAILLHSRILNWSQNRVFFYPFGTKLIIRPDIHSPIPIPVHEVIASSLEHSYLVFHTHGLGITWQADMSSLIIAVISLTQHRRQQPPRHPQFPFTCFITY
jgi:hypothetical protein